MAGRTWALHPIPRRLVFPEAGAEVGGIHCVVRNRVWA